MSRATPIPSIRSSSTPRASTPPIMLRAWRHSSGRASERLAICSISALAAGSSGTLCARRTAAGPRSSPRHACGRGWRASITPRMCSPADGMRRSCPPAHTTPFSPPISQRRCRRQTHFSRDASPGRAAPSSGSCRRNTARAGCASRAAFPRSGTARTRRPAVLRGLAPSAQPTSIALAEWTFSGVVPDIERLASYLADRLGWPQARRPDLTAHLARQATRDPRGWRLDIPRKSAVLVWLHADGGVHANDQ
jgi:hypothetical protein